MNSGTRKLLVFWLPPILGGVVLSLTIFRGFMTSGKDLPTAGKAISPLFDLIYLLFFSGLFFIAEVVVFFALGLIFVTLKWLYERAERIRDWVQEGD